MQEIFKPVMLLALWTMLIWLWLYATRLPAMRRAGLMSPDMVGTTGRSLRDDMVAKGEVRASWVADNYNHLHEAPTVFYAVAILLGMIGAGDGINAYIAWAYVALRIAHSVTQITLNHVVSRFVLFVASTICLMMLVAHGFAIVFDLHLPHLG